MDKTEKQIRLVTLSGYLVTTKSQEGVGLDAKILAKIEPNADAAMQAWCDRANAYPQLIEALKNLAEQVECMNAQAAFGRDYDEAKAILGEL